MFSLKWNKYPKVQRAMMSGLAFAFVVLNSATAFAGGNTDSKPWYTGFVPILLLLGAVSIMFWRLPKAKEDFSGQLDYLKNKAYRYRRAINWLVLGTMYAFLYWGRYNINGAIIAIGGKKMLEDFNFVFSAGTFIYGLSFFVNGPLTDRYGGRWAILIGAFGAAIANILMGVVCWYSANEMISADQLFWYLMFLYPINMYFQSFGAVAVVKCNAPWFHVRERGVFGAIFGILIALGIYFAFDWTSYILEGLKLAVSWAFFVPAVALAIMFIVGWFAVRNRPSDAGLLDIDVGDGLENDTKADPPVVVFKRMLKSPIIMTIACIEFCSGFIRQSNMQLYRPIAKAIGNANNFVYENWGLMLCCAGILGGVFAGTISDHFFKSRRGPVAVILYAGLLLTGLMMCFSIGSPILAWLVLSMSLCVIGVHGMLSGTASMDFGGRKNTGVAVGLIDGFVYMGTGLQAALYAVVLPKVKDEGSNNPAAWWFWPVAMVPIALIGLVLAYRIRNVSVKKDKEKEVSI